MMSCLGSKRWLVLSLGVPILLLAATVIYLGTRPSPEPRGVRQASTASSRTAPTASSRQTAPTVSADQSSSPLPSLSSADQQKRLELKWQLRRLGEGDLTPNRAPRIKPGAPPRIP